MKKTLLITFLIVSMLFKTGAYAINTDEYVNIYVSVEALTSETFEIPVGYDLFVENATIINEEDVVPPTILVYLNVYDDITLNYSGVFLEGETFGEYNLLFKDSLIIENVGDKDAGVLYVWYLIEEGRSIDEILNKSDSWINKSIFDEATLLEIYEYEGIIMIFILLYTFFMRVIGARRKRKVISF